MLGHRSIPGPPGRLTRFAVDSETAMEWKFASRCDLNYLIVPRTSADARSSSSLCPRINEFAKLEPSTAHDQLPGLQTPTAFHKANATCRFKLRQGRIEYMYVQDVSSFLVAIIPLSRKGRNAARVGDDNLCTNEFLNQVARSLES